MAFKNPSMVSNSINKEKQNEIFERLDKIEADIKLLKEQKQIVKPEEKIVESKIKEVEDFQASTDLDFESVSTTEMPSLNSQKEYEKLNVLDYTNRVYISNDPQRRGLISENQIKKLIEADNKDDVISIDNIITYGA